MNVTVNSQVLAAELRLHNKIVPTKPAIAILNHVLLRAGVGLEFYTTDLEIGLSSECEARVGESGAVALPVAKFLSLVEQFENGDVIVATEGQHVTVRCGAFKSRLQAAAAIDFPQMPQAEGPTCRINGVSLAQLIVKTRYAVNATSSKTILKGALTVFSGLTAAMVSTDAKRLALATAPRSAGTDTRFIIPVKALDALTSHLAEDCEITVGERNLSFTSSGRILTARMILGEFPAYERIIPPDNQHVVTIPRHTLSAALRRVNLVSEVNRAVFFDLTQNQLALTSSSAEVGAAAEDLRVQYDGPQMRICLNGDYVLDFLQASIGDSVTLSLKDDRTAALFADGDSYVVVIMLMRA